MGNSTSTQVEKAANSVEDSLEDLSLQEDLLEGIDSDTISVKPTAPTQQNATIPCVTRNGDDGDGDGQGSEREGEDGARNGDDSHRVGDEGGRDGQGSEPDDEDGDGDVGDLDGGESDGDGQDGNEDDSESEGVCNNGDGDDEFSDRDDVERFDASVITSAAAIVQHIDLGNPECQALVLAYDRHWAKAMRTVLVGLGNDLCMPVTCRTCVRGTNVREEMRILKRGVQIVVGTPGCVLDMIVTRKSLCTDSIKIFIVDDPEEMKAKGFGDTISAVYKTLKAKPRQHFLLKETQSGESSVDGESESDSVSRSDSGSESESEAEPDENEPALVGIKHFYVDVEKEIWKFDNLCDLYHYESLSSQQSVIFCNSVSRVLWLTQKFKEMKHSVFAMHEKVKEQDIEVIMKEFRSGSTHVLIATDAFCRGKNDQQVSLVINYELPKEPETYIQRIGRGQVVVINFVTVEDQPTLKAIEKFYNTQIVEIPEDVTTLF